MPLCRGAGGALLMITTPTKFICAECKADVGNNFVAKIQMRDGGGFHIAALCEEHQQGVVKIDPSDESTLLGMALKQLFDSIRDLDTRISIIKDRVDSLESDSV